MPMLFTDAQIQEAIVAMEHEVPGTWQQMIKLKQKLYKNYDEARLKGRECLHVMLRAFPRLAFVSEASDPREALNDLITKITRLASTEATTKKL